MTDTQTTYNANADSMKVAKNFKGEHSWEVKVYGDSSTPEGATDMEKRIKDLIGRIKDGR